MVEWINNYNTSYKKGMKKAYDKFCLEIRLAGVEEINKTLVSTGSKPIKFINRQIDSPLNSQKMKDSPWMKTKEVFENRENLYLRVIDLMKMFIRFEEKDFLKYACRQSNF